MAEGWFRYSDPWTPGEAPCLQTIPVERYTAKCAVLNEYGVRRYVLLDARKRYAYPTKELALNSYVIRKKRQMQHAAASHDNAKENLAAAEALQRGELPERTPWFVFNTDERTKICSI